MSKRKKWIGWVLTVLAVAPFVVSAAVKFAGIPQVSQGMEHLGWPQTMIFRLGVIEALCAVLYLMPPTSVLGAVLLTGYMGGAIATHLRVGEGPWVLVAFGVMAWLGLYLREERLAVLLPIRADDFKFEREVTINRPHSEVFTYLKPLGNFQKWNPFLRKDPNTKIATQGQDAQIGFVTSWEGNREVGIGEQEITRIIEGQRIEYELRFTKPFAATNQVYFAAEPVGQSQTRVRWGMSGKCPFPMNLLGLIFNSEKMIGREFDWGLNKLKSILEG
jgi:DoxX-like family/Polyketide cyclase / dehydrase and lipid transport